MAQSPGNYDERLLKDAPAVTNEQIHKGYNQDLLVPSPGKSHDDSHTFDKKVRKETPPSAKVSFWRTTKGIIFIAVLAFVIIVAIIGGAVGGTGHKAKPKNANETANGKANGKALSSSSSTVAAGITGFISSLPQSTVTVSGIPGGLSSVLPTSTATIASSVPNVPRL